MKTLRILLLACLLGVPAISATPSAAQSDSACKNSQDCALGAFKDGAVKPLSDVLAVVQKHLPGEVVKVELEREDGIWVYEIKVLTPSGRRREIEIDARTLAVIKID